MADDAATMSRVAFLLFLAGLGTFLLGLLVVGYKCLRWLHDGFWTSTDIRTAWLWTGSKLPPVTGELGLDKILAWILDQPLELGLIVGGLVVFFVSAPLMDR
jgi:hypothetical protein